MSEEIRLCDCGQYLIIDSLACNDLKQARGLLFRSIVLDNDHQTYRLLAHTNSWVSRHASMEQLLQIVDVFSRFEKTPWRIAIITPEVSQQTVLLEQLLDFKQVCVRHFAETSSANSWLMGCE